MFTEKFSKYACIGDTITTEKDGYTITARIELDTVMREPWKEHDGHGVISEWTRRDKKPGERILAEDHGARLYYDMQESITKAKTEGWDAPPYGEGTLGERAARAVEADFQAMRAWCNDEWFWCGIALSISKNGIELDDYAAGLWGIECNYPNGENKYLTEVANELLSEALARGKQLVIELCSAR